ncbi:MAG TPA: DUF1775 domain-containing protein [Gaiellaceae bacterium]|nr:DUF1775 domain-containing protein [Gaiellaceae bacterium]
MTKVARLRTLSTVLAAAAIAAAAAPSAFAHAVVRPSESRPADLQLYTLTVPTERDVPTTGVDLKVPNGIDFLLVEDSGPWHARLVRANGRIDQIRWRGSAAAPGYFATFHFIARNPITPGDLAWKIVQRYKDGKDVFWIGAPSSDTPAATVKISESATAEDTLAGLNGGAQSQPTVGAPAGGAEATASSSKGGRDGLTLALAGVGAAAGLLALLAVLGLNWRRRA